MIKRRDLLIRSALAVFIATPLGQRAAAADFGIPIQELLEPQPMRQLLGSALFISGISVISANTFTGNCLIVMRDVDMPPVHIYVSGNLIDAETDEPTNFEATAVYYNRTFYSAGDAESERRAKKFVSEGRGLQLENLRPKAVFRHEKA